MVKFVDIPINEYQSIIPDRFTIYHVYKVPGLYQKDGHLLETWDELKSVVDGKHLAPLISVTDYNGYAELFGDNTYADELHGILIVSDEIISISDLSYSEITGIIIPDSVTQIMSRAFAECQYLETVILGNEITKIPNDCFSRCFSLKTIILNEYITEIGAGAFFQCEKLSYIKLPDSLKIIEGEAFTSCLNLKSITIPASVTVVRAGALPVNEIYQNKIKISDGMDEIIFENPRGWYLCSDKKGEDIIKAIDFSNSKANNLIMREHSSLYFVRKDE